MLFLLGIIFILILIVLYIYNKYFTSNNKPLGRIFFSFCVIVFTIAIIINPEECFNSAKDGLNTWLNIVFPSLLPFFIGSDLLINLKVVDFIGKFLEPLMRPVFNVPGCGSFPFMMSITSGYPVGSKIVAELYTKKMCDRDEAQRLLSFCSTSGPLFMIGAVGIGMLNARGSGLVIAASNYIGAISVGIIFRFYKYKKEEAYKISRKNAEKIPTGSLKYDKRPIGLMLSDSVKNSVNSLLTIGGFIILFSVLIKLLYLSGIIGLLSRALYIILNPFGVSKQLFAPISGGLIEITVGSKMIASSDASVYQKIIASSGIIAWSGLSVHAQVASMISNTDLKMSTYMISKFLHGILSAAYSYFILNIEDIKGLLSVETFAQGSMINKNWLFNLAYGFERYIYSLILLFSVIFIYKAISNLYNLIRRSFF